MTHADLITHVYANFSFFRGLWSRRCDETGEFGAFVFLPGKDLNWEWWSLVELRDYAREGGLDDKEMLEGVNEPDFGEDFLVLVIEYVDGPKTQQAHFHRISKAKMN